MNRSLFLLLICFLAGIAGVGTSAQARGDSLRVMTYNVRNCLGPEGDSHDYRAVADAIMRGRADFIAVQELDSATRRSGGEYVLGRLAALTGMQPLYARAIDYDGGAYGIGILSHERPLSVRRIALPGREEARALIVAEFDSCVFASTHLSLTEPDRLASVSIIAAEAAAASKPFIVAGDWNAEPGSAVLEAFRKAGFTILTSPDAHTYPADNPVETIDYIAVYGEAPAHTAEVIAEPSASDHRPVTVSIERP